MPDPVTGTRPADEKILFPRTKARGFTRPEETEPDALALPFARRLIVHHGKVVPTQKAKVTISRGCTDMPRGRYPYAPLCGGGLRLVEPQTSAWRRGGFWFG